MEMTVMTKGGGVDMLLMTKKEMMELRPGEELDELVAVRVMGFMAMMESQKMVVDGEEKEVFRMDAEGNPSLIPPYSTDMGEAWKVVEKLSEEGWKIQLRQVGDGFLVQLQRREEFGTEQVEVHGEFPRVFTAPEAIVKCALLAKSSG